MERLRTFISIDIEDASILDRLVAVQEELSRSGADLKIVERRNIHLTIRFLGQIPSIMVDEVAKVMERARVPKFNIAIRGLGAFPGISRPRVIWAGVIDSSGSLVKIHKEIELGLRRLGFKRESEEFVPHITLARLKSRRNIERVVQVIRRYEDELFGEMVVKCIRLKRSILTPRGPIYSTLREVQLE